MLLLMLVQCREVLVQESLNSFVILALVARTSTSTVPRVTRVTCEKLSRDSENFARTEATRDPPAACGNVRTYGALRPDCMDQKETLVMDKDRVEGAGKQVKGAVKEAVGKVTGDAKTQAEGRADKAEGKVQNAVGGAKDAARDALKE
jgi:uncharacterized protein YjbJ (UPF0337 family)